MAISGLFTLLEFDEIDSTSDEAKRLIKSGKAVGRQIIVAQGQSSGHGRYGRTWQSPKGNLYASLLLKVSHDLYKNAQYSFVAAVTLGEVIEENLPNGVLKVECKWPNDILVEGKKVSGILLESVSDPHGDNWLVIGVGVNILVNPDGIENLTTSLKESGAENVCVNSFLERFIQTFERKEKMWQIEGFSCIRSLWLNRAYKLGEEIKVNLGEEVVFGKFKGINACGELEVVVGGENRLISSGEVFFSTN